VKNREGVAGHEEPQRKHSWEPMTLTAVGNLGAVVRGASGSISDGGVKGQNMQKAP
jgi:hypothetical protein